MWQLVWGVWISIASSATSSMGGYISPILKDPPYNYSQSRLAFLGTVVSVLANVAALASGWIFDRYGPQWCLRVGALCIFIGQGLIALMLYETISLNFGLLIIATSLHSNSGAFYESGSFVSNIATFSKDKGSVMIVEESLGGAIFAAWYVGFFNNDAKLLLIFVTIVTPLVGLLGSLVIRKPSVAESMMPQHGHKRFSLAYLIVAITVCVFLTKDIIENSSTLSSTPEIAIAVFGVVACFGYAVVPLVCGKKTQHLDNYMYATCNSCDEHAVASYVQDTHVQDTRVQEAAQDFISSSSSSKGEAFLPDSGGVDHAIDADATVETLHDVTLQQALTSVDFYLLIVISIAQWGVADMIASASPQIYRALNKGVLDTAQNATYISAMSIFNSVARIAVALLDTRVVDKVGSKCSK
jgi:hypothetical protein